MQNSKNIESGEHMKKLSLKKAADEFDIINVKTHLFYNTKTGEFDHYDDYMVLAEVDAKKFEDKAWIAAPSSWDIGEYEVMEAFAETVTDPRISEQFSEALMNTHIAPRRFLNVLHQTDLMPQWYAYKLKAYMEKARKWCEENGITYDE
jgi:hypothetical protein